MKEYPMRGQEIKKPLDPAYTFKVCQCGHAWHNHQLEHQDKSTQCEICTCPKYEFEKTMLVSDYRKQRDYIAKNNRSFTT